ncbi:hypothetical protein K435DRAFT_843545 [Dendrothele bispora CBS 962.96]|uniref:DUF6534 domain-containing protein n=1 Tax=Dendrothele bispora (strain CBS 962.96) TaxID=1314807 RepID=A0A4S8L7T9_DENBC|nr:hypothetical protein K435DRAFT_843545 [Dendrothele bispora CBS 962.96]
MPSSPTSDSPLPVLTLDNTIGVLFIGCIVGAVYLVTYKKDAVPLKVLVLVTWTFDAVHQALITHAIYFYLIQNYFNPGNLDNYEWSLKCLTTVCVQGFFVRRIIRLSGGSFILTGIATAFVLAKFAYIGKGFPIHSLKHGLAELHTISEAVNGITAATDVVITVILCWLLYRQPTITRQTNMLINKLIIYTMSTGLLTAICAVITLITAHSMPKNYIYSSFYFIMARLYVNSMLATLNARISLSKKFDNSRPPSPIAFASNADIGDFGHGTKGTVAEMDTQEH